MDGYEVEDTILPVPCGNFLLRSPLAAVCPFSVLERPLIS